MHTGRNQAQERTLEVIRAGKRFVISGHMRPDGDCIGAEAALKRGLEALGKEVWIVNPDPPEPQFDYLTSECKYGTYRPGADLPAHDVFILLDASELSRCGALGEKVAASDSKKLVIDHHIHVGDEWWDEAFVDVTASASGLLVYRVLNALEVKLDRVMALGVFTSIVTDTGWFKYSNTDAETMITAGELIAAGVEPSLVYGAIYQRESSSLPTSIGRVLQTLEYYYDGKLAVVKVEPAKKGETALTDGDLVLDILRSVKTVEVVLLLRTTEDGKCKLSARSKDEYDVNRLAREFGGGGHRKASGATIDGSLDEVATKLIEAAKAGFVDDGVTHGA